MVGNVAQPAEVWVIEREFAGRRVFGFWPVNSSVALYVWVAGAGVFCYQTNGGKVQVVRANKPFPVELASSANFGNGWACGIY